MYFSHNLKIAEDSKAMFLDYLIIPLGLFYLVLFGLIAFIFLSKILAPCDKLCKKAYF